MTDGEKKEVAGDAPAEQAPSEEVGADDDPAEKEATVEEVVGDIPAPKKEKRKSSSADKGKSKRASTIKKDESKKSVGKAPDPPEAEVFSEMKQQLNQRYSEGRSGIVAPPRNSSNDLEMGRNSKVLISKKSSVLASSDDPFATREGKTLLWRDINMVLAGNKDGEKDSYLLEGVWGEVPQRKTTAIMGPSGTLKKWNIH